MQTTEDLVRDAVRNMGICKDNLKESLAKVFEDITVTYNLCRDYQARAVRFGEAFEAYFRIVMETFFPDIRLASRVSIPEVCMVEGGEADFAVIHYDGRIIAVIEAKGSADHIVCNGKRIELKRPGMLRTDTVKKAICNAYLLSRVCPNILFFIVTSHKPTAGNAKCMCDIALDDVVDGLIDATDYNELEMMVEIIRECR